MARSSTGRAPRSLYLALAAIALFVVGLGAAFVSVWRRAPAGGPQPVRPQTAVGDATCIACHRDKASYEATAHRSTMRLPSTTAIRGSFREGENVLRTPDPDVYFHMHADSTGVYQTAVVGRAPDTTTHSERFAYVVGSGRRGQSFLYWSDGRLFQMPVSYWATAGRWMGSPGPGVHVDPRASFGRTIAPRCLECHATWLESVPDPAVTNRFTPEGAVLGITCERCHGAGQEHVARARAATHGLREPAIANPARMSRERRMEACAQCHAGTGSPQRPTFSYVAGRPLDDYLHVARRRPDDTTAVDVHGNQVTALAQSACYRSSQMTCGTCHDPHRTERDPAALSGRCLTCHTEQSCGLFPQRGHALAGKCVDCHMPLQASERVVTDDLARGASVAQQARSHWIRVYREAAIR